jgi:hypothetical protein
LRSRHTGRRKAGVFRDGNGAISACRTGGAKIMERALTPLCNPAASAWHRRCDLRSICMSASLPINLRSFLIERLGIAIGCDQEPDITTADSDAVMMQELARAIRCFSAKRARESWAECAVSLEALERSLLNAARAGKTPVLCLTCGELSSPDVDSGHCAPNCLQVTLQPPDAECPCLEAVRHAVERFRRVRADAGVPHHDLDCFIAGGRMIFTWRRLSAPANITS